MGKHPGNKHNLFLWQEPLVIQDRCLFPHTWHFTCEVLGGNDRRLTHGLLLLKMISFLSHSLLAKEFYPWGFVHTAPIVLPQETKSLHCCGQWKLLPFVPFGLGLGKLNLTRNLLHYEGDVECYGVGRVRCVVCVQCDVHCSVVCGESDFLPYCTSTAVCDYSSGQEYEMTRLRAGCNGAGGCRSCL